jgi:hypothetical protein
VFLTRAALEDARARSVKGIGSPEVAIRQTVDVVRAVSKEIRDPAQSLERRREALRRFLPTRNGERPIRIEFDFAAFVRVGGVVRWGSDATHLVISP